MLPVLDKPVGETDFNRHETNTVGIWTPDNQIYEFLNKILLVIQVIVILY